MQNNIGLKKRDLFDIPITVSPLEDIISEIQRLLNIPGCVISLYTPNPEIIAYAKKEKTFFEIVRKGNINIPDGSGIVWALKRLYGENIPRLSGADLFTILSEKSIDWGYRIGLVGGDAGVAVSAMECLKKTYPRLNGVVLESAHLVVCSKQDAGGKSPSTVINIDYMDYARWDLSEYVHVLAGEIEKKNIHMVFVAYGFPKQEYLISLLQDVLEQKKLQHGVLLMAVGGSFDYMAGIISRAPMWMRDRGFEWLYRLIRQPWRISRQLTGAKFFFDVIRL